MRVVRLYGSSVPKLSMHCFHFPLNKISTRKEIKKRVPKKATMTLEVDVVAVKRFIIFSCGFGGNWLGFRFRWRLGCHFFACRLLLHHLRVWYMFFKEI